MEGKGKSSRDLEMRWAESNLFSFPCLGSKFQLLSSLISHETTSISSRFIDHLCELSLFLPRSLFPLELVSSFMTRRSFDPFHQHFQPPPSCRHPLHSRRLHRSTSYREDVLGGRYRSSPRESRGHRVRSSCCERVDEEGEGRKIGWEEAVCD